MALRQARSQNANTTTIESTLAKRPTRLAAMNRHPQAYTIDHVLKSPVRSTKNHLNDEEPLTPASKIARSLESLSMTTPDGKRKRSSSRSGKGFKNPADSNIDVEFEDGNEKENIPPEDSDSESIGKRTRSAKKNDQDKGTPLLTSNRKLEIEPVDVDMSRLCIGVTSNSKNLRNPRKSLFDAGKNAVTPIRMKKKSDTEFRISKTPKDNRKITIKLKKDIDGATFRVSNTPNNRVRTPTRASCRQSNFDIKQLEQIPIKFRKSKSDPKIDESFDSDNSTSSEDDNESSSDSSISDAPPMARTRRGKPPSPVKSSRNNAANRPRTAQRQIENLETIVRRLHTAEVPENLPCREKEMADVETFIRSCIAKKGVSQAMYISGVPGTGKTATVNAVVNKLMDDHTAPKFKYCYVNAMELIDPRHIFIQIYNVVSDNQKKISGLMARRKLNQMFETIDKSRNPIIIMVDELDYMCTKRQELIYDLFNWTANEGARVNVLAIANTLDLPERMLSQKITSRLGSNRLTFQPYDFNQIDKIIQDRLSGSSAVEENAVKLASRKIAAISGDLRKAIDMLRRAAEMAIEAKSEKLTMENVTQAIKEAASTIRAGLVNGLSRHKLTLFRAAVAQVQQSGVDEFQFGELLKHYRLLCTQFEGVESFNESLVREMSLDLSSNRLLVASSGNNWWKRRFRLGMSVQEAQFALKQTDDERKAKAA